MPRHMQQDADSGFSLTELLVVLGLMGIVMSLTYAALWGVQNGYSIASRQSQFASDVALPMQVLDKLASQATTVTTPNGYTAAYGVQISQPTTNTTTRYDVWAATADHKLMDYQYRQTGASSVLVRSVNWSTLDTGYKNTSGQYEYNNGNVSSNTDLFSYLDSSGNPTPTAHAAALVITVVVRNWDARSHRWMTRTGKRLVYLRNTN